MQRPQKITFGELRQMGLFRVVNCGRHKRCMPDIITIVGAAVLIGFLMGYGVRELISRRRHDKSRRRPRT